MSERHDVTGRRSLAVRRRTDRALQGRLTRMAVVWALCVGVEGRRLGNQHMKIGSRIVAPGALLAITVLAGCVARSRVSDQRLIYTYAPREDGCQARHFKEVPYPPDPSRFELLGTVLFLRRQGDPVVDAVLPEHRADLTRRVCQWGGDGYLVASQTHTDTSAPWSVGSGYLYVVVRELRPGEVSRTSRTLGVSEDKLRQQVAFDEGCPPEKVQVVSKDEDQGTGSYRVRACGKELRYRRIGTVYERVGTGG